MSLRKLCCFTMLAAIVAFAAAGTLNRHTRQFDVAMVDTSRPQSALAANGWPTYSGQSAKQLGRSHWANAVRTKAEIPPPVFIPVQSFVPAQSKDARDLGAGKLLVATRGLADPNFAKAVILLVHYDDQGVVGLILNRRTHVALSEVLEGVQGAKDRSDLAYLGGPVEVPAMLALLQSPVKVEGAEHIFSGVYMISTKTLLEQTLAARPDPQVFHVYLGYAGWTKDQLQKEVELGAWFIFPGDTSAVFNPDPGSLWPQMIRKTELRFARTVAPKR